MPIWDSISTECKDLIGKMLRPAVKRITPAQVLEHNWFKILKTTASELLPVVVTQQLNTFRTYQKVKKAVLTYLATQLSQNEMRPLRVHFIQLDKNGDGILSTEEVIKGIEMTAVRTDLCDIVGALDTNESGFIDYNGKTL